MTSLLEQCWDDYPFLDGQSEDRFPGARVITTEDFPPPQTVKLEPASFENRLGPLGALIFGVRLYFACRQHDCLLLNQVDRFAQATCILNRWLPGRRRKIVLYDVFFSTPSPVKRLLVKWMVQGATLNVVFSRLQVSGYAKYFDLPEDRFFFLPYKANHSRKPPIDKPVQDYVFSGGNSERDYRTLFEAVRGTDVPVLVSTTQPHLVEGLDVPDNVTIREIREPEFAEAMAASRFVVMTLTAGRIRGYGEQTICNSMWHGRPFIAADDVSASDYIEDGVTGYVVDPGDVSALRERIRELWSNPEKCIRMGRAAHDSVAARFTYDHFIFRMRILSLMVAAAE